MATAKSAAQKAQEAKAAKVLAAKKAKEQDKTPKVQTTSSFSFRGIVDGLNRDNAFRDDEIKQGKHKGKEYHAIRFQLQTSKVNKLSVELFGMELDFVYPYKRGKKGEKGTVLRNHPFAKRHNLPEGYTLIGVQLGLEEDENGKIIRENMVDFDAAEYIFEHLNDGDSVNISGEISFSVYEKDDGSKVDQVKYSIKSIVKEKTPIDFDADNFKEINAFEQEIVFVDAEWDKDEQAAFVTAYTIQYGDKFQTANFVIRPNGNVNIEKTAKAFLKKLKFGDLLKVSGLAFNKVVLEISDEVEEDDIFGGEKPEGLKDTIKSWIVELQITYVDSDSYKAGVGTYTENDFEVEAELVIDEPEDDDDDSDDDDDVDFGNDDDDDDLDDDSLPF